jgi:hypothetical protein
MNSQALASDAHEPAPGVGLVPHVTAGAFRSLSP